MKQFLKRYIPRSILEPYQMKKYGRFLWMRMQTEGLLSPEHYKAIHKFFLGHAIGEHDIVEVGGADLPGIFVVITSSVVLQETPPKAGPSGVGDPNRTVIVHVTLVRIHFDGNAMVGGYIFRPLR